MLPTEALAPDFWGLDLCRGVMDLSKNHAAYCFLIAEHQHDIEFIRKQALSLIVARCRNLSFYGKERDTWHFEADRADIQVYPDMETVALTSGFDDLDDFMHELICAITVRPIVPYSTYLIYDDREIYAEVLKRLKIAGKIA